MLHVFSLLIGIVAVLLIIGIIYLIQEHPEIIAYGIAIIFLLGFAYVMGYGFLTEVFGF